MPTPSFYEWLRNRPDEAPAADNLATIIASAGAAGVSVDRLRRVVGLSPETLQDILKSLTATGQVDVLKVNGQMTYRATM
jgi:predicted transcriptional regulator